MTWTNKPPKKDGWYWMRYKDPQSISGQTTQIVYLLVVGDKGYVFGVKDNNVQDVETQWAGPIPEPDEA